MLKPVEPAHRFEVTLEPDDFTEEKYKVYEDYQMHVHHDSPSDVTRNGFKRFLCSSPLRRKLRQLGDGREQPLGSYHQCYRLDGRLIAFAVLDLLPHAVSGVYFVYHQDFEKWSFGKLSAMREAAFALEQGYQFYYMGYYIHTCTKMEYKGEYKPQYVLDPISHEWNLLDDEMRSLLDKQTFVSLALQRQLDKGEDQTTTKIDNPFEWEYKKPTDAAASGKSLLEFKMPGIMSAEEIEEHVNMNDIGVYIRQGLMLRTQVRN